MIKLKFFVLGMAIIFLACVFINRKRNKRKSFRVRCSYKKNKNEDTHRKDLGDKTYEKLLVDLKSIEPKFPSGNQVIGPRIKWGKKATKNKKDVQNE